MSQSYGPRGKEKRTKYVRVYLTTSEYEQLQRMACEGGCNLSLTSVARQRIFHPAPTHHSMATLQANLQRAYRGLSYIHLCLQSPLDSQGQADLLNFICEVISQIDQTIDQTIAS